MSSTISIGISRDTAILPTNPFFQWNAIAALAAAADVLKGWDDALAKDCLETAIKAWNDVKAHPTQNPTDGGLGGAEKGKRFAASREDIDLLACFGSGVICVVVSGVSR